MMKNILSILILLALLGLPVSAQTCASAPFGDGTISGLPANAGCTNKVTIITDGADSADCTVAGGSSRVACQYTGSAWVPIALPLDGGSLTGDVDLAETGPADWTALVDFHYFGIRGMVNSPTAADLFTPWQRVSGLTGASEAPAGAVAYGSGEGTAAVVGVSGYAISRSANVTAGGGYFWAAAGAAHGVFGINPVGSNCSVNNALGLCSTAGGSTFASPYVVGSEANVYAQDTAPEVVAGVRIRGVSNVQGTTATAAIYVDDYNYNIPGDTKWVAGVQGVDGFVNHIVYGGTISTGNGVGSQYLTLKGRESGGTDRYGLLQVSDLGDWRIIPGNPGNVSEVIVSADGVAIGGNASAVAPTVDLEVYDRRAANSTNMFVKAGASQSGNVLEVVDNSDADLFTVDGSGNTTIVGTLTMGSGSTPWNLNGFTDDVAPGAGAAANQFNAYVDRTTGLWAWHINSGSVQLAANANTSGDALDAVKVAATTPGTGGLAVLDDANVAAVLVTIGAAEEIAAGTATLGTSAIATTACATVVTVTATGTATTDVISWTPNADITAVTGYAPATAGGLAIYLYPTTNNINVKVCNPTSSSITPGAVTLNWRVDR